jgi:hypothetical protein
MVDGAEDKFMESNVRNNKLQSQLNISHHDHRCQIEERFDYETKLKTENSLLKERHESNKASFDGYRKQFEIIDDFRKQLNDAHHPLKSLGEVSKE